MITVRSAELLIGLITFFIAYAIAVTIAGAFRAWVTKNLGDDTAEYAGLLTLNPIAHIDMIGVIFLFLFYFGWGRYVPINPFNIHAPWRRVKLFVAYLSDTFAYFASALIGIILLVVMGGRQVLFIAHHMLICVQNMTHLYLVSSCPTLSSLTITLSFIVIAFVYLNLILGVLNFILNICMLGISLFMEHSGKSSSYHSYVILFTPIILILLFSEPLRLLALNFISFSGYAISQVLGLV